jgi:hypothetical protein
MITKHDTERIIEALGDGICDYYECSPTYRPPIMIGDVLEWMFDQPGGFKRDELGALSELWASATEGCVSKSLQEILADAEWGEELVSPDARYDTSKPITILKSPAAELFELLDTFLLKEG